MRFRVFTILFVLTLVGCESKGHKLAELQAQYNAAYADYVKDCPAIGDTSGAARMLTGEKLTAAQIADLEAKKKAQEARCKPQSDHLAEIQRQILAAQQ
jgi:hypothetical protein